MHAIQLLKEAHGQAKAAFQKIEGAPAHERPALWGKLGRKVDPTGTKPTRPVMSMVRVRELVAARLVA